MKRLLLIILLSVFCFNIAEAQDRRHFTYYDLNPYLQASPGAFRFGLNGYDNPANLAINGGHFETSLFVNSNNTKISDFNNIAYFLQAGSMGYGLVRKEINGHRVTNHRLSLGFGGRKFALGFGWGFYSGDKDYFNYENTLQYGLIYRPTYYLSLGYSGLYAMNANQFENTAEIGVRPIKNYPLTFYLDAAMYESDKLKDARWGGGISWEFLDGVRVNGRYFSDNSIRVGVDLNMGGLALSVNNLTKTQNTTYGIRFCGNDRTLFDDVNFKMNQYIKMELVGNYGFSNQKFSVGSTSKTTLSSLLKKFDKIIADENIKGVVINIDKLTADYSTKWEIRNKLEQVKQAGKKIIIFASNMDFTTYHLASIADNLYLDDFGIMTFEGFASGRSYYKKLLDKIGIGYEEIRLFKYKSAVESFTRNEFSEGEKEQRQKLIDDMYEYAKKEIIDSRKMTPDKFEELVNGSFIISSKKAISEKLIEGTGRWNNLDTIIKKIDKKAFLIGDNILIDMPKAQDDKWSAKESGIAVVYADGACDMETGIKAKELSRIMKSVLENDDIKAVIFRINSPGGSAMASDYVAEVIRKHKGKKPIIVSQAAVAGSGGYWLSMDADTILATPMTITGSIGVIAGWMYNKGLADSLGVNTSIIKRGNHSDLGYPFAMPLIGIGLPIRNLTESELTDYKNMISESYVDFVKLVAKGRNMDSAKVHDIAQGRVWTGISGKENGLVDIIGGLDKSISLAKELIKDKKDEKIAIFEYKPEDDFSFLNLLEFISMKSKETVKTLMFDALFDSDMSLRIKNNGKPLMLLPADYYDYIK